VWTSDPLGTASLPVTFEQPALATVADRHARAFMAWFWRHRGRGLARREHLLLATVVVVVVALLVEPLALGGVVLLLGQLGWVVARRTRVLARSLADGPGATAPSTVVIDDDGVGVAGSAGAEHHGWDELGAAAILRGFLVLQGHEGSPAEIVCLDHLGDQVDRAALLAEVRRRMAAARPTT
jgi:hypothetical protein